jgi:arginase family enzyme
VNPYEEVAIDNTFIEKIYVQELRTCSEAILQQMERLSSLTDIIYVHVDMSVLDPGELPNFSRPVAGGPTSEELAACLKIMFTFPKTAALGIASFPNEAEEITLKAAYRLIEGAIQGVKAR